MLAQSQHKHNIIMDKKTKRNIIGSIICFFLSLLLGGIGIAIMMYREVLQSNKGDFPIEKDDIIRYSVVGAVGGICHDALLIIGINHLWFS